MDASLVQPQHDAATPFCCPKPVKVSGYCHNDVFALLYFLRAGLSMTNFDTTAGSNLKITDSDRQILGLLQQNARRTVSEIATITGLSRGTVKDRIDMLVDRQVIKKFTIELSDLESHTQNAVAAFFLLKSKRPICRVIYASIRAWPELVGCWSIAGDLDMVVLLQSTKIDELHRLRDKLACHPEVKWLQTLSILTEWTSKLNFTGREFLERIGQPVLEDLVETLPTTRERAGTEALYAAPVSI